MLLTLAASVITLCRDKRKKLGCSESCIQLPATYIVAAIPLHITYMQSFSCRFSENGGQKRSIGLLVGVAVLIRFTKITQSPAVIGKGR